MTVKSINPHCPTDVVLEFGPATAQDVTVAAARAREAFRAWRDEPAISRGRALAGIANDLESAQLHRLVVREVGKPISEARAEVERAVAILRYYSQMILAADGETYPATDSRTWLIARRYPVGVCALITPWNFPVAIPCWKLAPALGYGNAVLLKPASAATAIAQVLGEIACDHLPRNVFQVVAGDATTGEAILDNADVAAISFTGSLAIGRHVAQRAVARGARSQCEMGGQNPSIVLADADLDRAASTIAYAAMGYAGQKCTATSRVIIEAAVYEEMQARLVNAVELLNIVDPGNESCLVGPLISDASRISSLDAIERGGGRIMTGGKPLDVEGYYLLPTLVEIDDPTSVLAKEEVFAPVTAVLKAGSAEEAIQVANDVRYGLVAAVFTKDLERATKLVGRLEAGLVRVNAATSGVDFHAPFGGAKASSVGPREQGLAAREFYTETRTVLIAP